MTYYIKRHETTPFGEYTQSRYFTDDFFKKGTPKGGFGLNQERLYLNDPSKDKSLSQLTVKEFNKLSLIEKRKVRDADRKTYNWLISQS